MDVKNIILEIEMMRDDPNYFLTADKASVLMMYVIQARLQSSITLPDYPVLEMVVQRISEHAKRTIDQINTLLDGIDPAIAIQFTEKVAPTLALFSRVPDEFQRMLLCIKEDRPFEWHSDFLSYLRK